MTYDDESRLTSVTSPAGSESFAYNALGQRMQLTVGGAVTKYVYDGDRVLEETDSAGNVLARYTTTNSSYYAPLLHMYRTSGSLSRLPMFDLTGSVRGLLDASGTVTDTYSLEVFGKQRSSTGTTPNPYRGVYPERSRRGGAWGYRTGSSGLLQLGARYYWPEIGRFIQQDPARSGMNSYGYAGGNPLTRLDPTGLYFTVVGDRAPFDEAIAYLRGGGAMGSLVDRMENSPNEYTVYVGNYEDRGAPGWASWSPYAALSWGPSLESPLSGTISPALALGHELAHAAEPPELFELLRSLGDPNGFNAEEANAMWYEQQGAWVLGEDIRDRYAGLMFPVTGPLDRDYQAFRDRCSWLYPWW